MAAPVIEAGAAYSGVSAGSINTTAPAVVDADDIIVIVAQAHNTSGTVASVITMPTGFASIFPPLTCKDASGVSRGLIAAAWKRADGTEDGATLTVGHNGATGAATHLGARTFRIIGCKTTGNPFTQAVTNNPNNTNLIDFPAITTSGTEKSLLTMHVNSDNNATIASLTDWTIVGTNGNNGTGSDGSNSAFKRENLSAGTYDPPSPTIANTNATGWVTFQIEFEPPAGGNNWTVTPADGFALTDSATTQSGKTASVADALALTDARTFARTLVRAEAFALTDARALAQGKALADAFALTDATTANRGLVRALADSLSLTDATTRVTGKGVSVADGFALTDARAFARLKVIADGFGLTDARTFARTLRLAETFGLTDARSFARLLALVDALGLTDNAVPTLTLGGATNWTRNIADGFALTDEILLAFSGAAVAATRFTSGPRGRLSSGPSGRITSGPRGTIRSSP